MSLNSELPSGIVKEGDPNNDTGAGKVYYLKQCDQVFLADSTCSGESVASVIANLAFVNEL